MTQPELRDRLDITKRHNALKINEPAPTPHEERGTYDLNHNGLKHEGRLIALRWLLEPRSTEEVYHKLKETANSGVTADKTGAKVKIRHEGEVEELLWALQVDSLDELEHPQSFNEQLISAKDELLDLKMRIQDVGYPQGDSDLVELNEDPDVDVEFLIEQINDSYESLRKAEKHLLNSPDEENH